MHSLFCCVEAYPRGNSSRRTKITCLLLIRIPNRNVKVYSFHASISSISSISFPSNSHLSLCLLMFFPARSTCLSKLPCTLSLTPCLKMRHHWDLSPPASSNTTLHHLPLSIPPPVSDEHRAYFTDFYIALISDLEVICKAVTVRASSSVNAETASASAAAESEEIAAIGVRRLSGLWRRGCRVRKGC